MGEDEFATVDASLTLREQDCDNVLNLISSVANT